ncbi:hypothetical protein CERSUDRAFT_124087 [Gelatoporia subvermispora B]|uniref:NACHT domain-containing protein n=1 Tax=Ceriporiopsis subvermispora (strain B) TaxID=914234 RepID=M2PLA9_CERS8|nr:hypothetical protein CERSUDRAFT_124087 [Gelatoporia subvermispora B]
MSSSEEEHEPARRMESTHLEESSAALPLMASPNLRTTLKETGWSVLKGVLKAVKDNCGQVPGLPVALSGVIAVMDMWDDADEAQSKYNEIAHNISAIIAILAQYNSVDVMPQFMVHRLNWISHQLKDIEEAIKMKTQRNLLNRMVEASGDKDKVETLFRHLVGTVEYLQLECNLFTADKVDKLYAQNLLDKLSESRNASIESQNPDSACMSGTRVQLLDDLNGWARDPSPRCRRIFWLNGMAGTGKSAIARSFCYNLHDRGMLAGSFFCSRGVAGRDDVKRILPTLASSLAHQSPAYRTALLRVLEQHPNAGHDNIELQVERLIKEPLSYAFKNKPPMLVFVIDALDECSDAGATESVLEELIDASVDIPIRFFLTSRPESHIRTQFESRHPNIHLVLRLHEIEQDLVQEDISLYIDNRLLQIRQRTPDNYPNDWPSRADVTALTHRAGLLFIYAFTALEYIKKHPVKRFKIITSTTAIVGQPMNIRIDEMYAVILGRAMDRNECEEDDILATRQIIAAILTVREPQRLCDLAELTNMPVTQIRNLLDDLHAVVHVPSLDDNGVVSTFHASFGDYMTTSTRSKEFYIDPRIGHHDLANSCIRVMDSKLHFNMLQTPTSYEPTTDRASSITPTYLLYACLYWSHHLCLASQPEQVFLFWVEVFSAIGQVQAASSLIMKASTADMMKNNQELTALLRDANEFIVSCREAIETSAPHIYLSALPSISPTSRIAQAYWPEFHNTATFHPRGIGRHRNTLLHIKGHTSWVTSVSVSSDGTRIASGSIDRTIRVWDARTGEEVTKPLTGHTGWVYSVAFSPDGTHITSGSDDKTIRIWDARTAEEVVKPLTGHGDIVQSVVFSPDGTCVISGSSDCTIRVWDVRTGREVMEPLAGHTRMITSVAISPDGTRIASGSGDRTVRVWDMATGKEVTEPLKVHDNWVRSVVFSLDGSKIISGSDDHTIRLWDAKTAEPRAETLTGHTGWVNSVAFAPDGIYIASGSNDQSIRMWNTRTGQEVMEPLTGHTRSVTSVVFLPDGTQIVSGSNDGTIRVWDARLDEEAIKPLPGHTDSVNSVAFSPDGSRVASGSSDGTIRIWDSRTGEQVVKPLTGHEGRIRSIAFSPDGTQLASGSDDKTVRLWDAVTGVEVTKPLTGHTGTVYSVAFSSDGSQIASGSDDCTICLWNAATGEEVGEPLTGHEERVWSVAFSPNGSLIASGSADKTIRIWDTRADAEGAKLLRGHMDDIASGSDDCTICLWNAATGEEVGEPLTGHEERVWSVAFSPNGSLIASGSADKTIRIWDTRADAEGAKLLRGHMDDVYTVAFSADGTRVVSGSSDGSIRIWDASTGTETLKPLKGHQGAIFSVAVSPDGTRIASGASNGTICIWDARTGKEVIAPLTGHGDSVRSVAFSPDGTRIASGSDDGTVRIFDATIADPDESCSRREADTHRQVLDSQPSPATGAYTHPGASEHDPSPLPIQSPWPTHLTNLRHLKNATSTQDPRDMFSFALDSLDEPERWIKGPRGELILWIPPEYRHCLYGPRNTLVIGTGAVSLNMHRYLSGTDHHFYDAEGLLGLYYDHLIRYIRGRGLLSVTDMGSSSRGRLARGDDDIQHTLLAARALTTFIAGTQRQGRAVNVDMPGVD